MKKISKILLPMSAVATTTMAVTPLVACGGTVNLLKYSPDPKTRHEPTKLNKEQATDALFGNENAIGLIKQDILTYLSWELGNELSYALLILGLDWVGHVQKATAKLSNLKLNYDSTEHIARLSGTIELKAVCNMMAEKDQTQLVGSYTLKTIHTLDKMPYHIVYDNYYWSSYFSADELTKKYTDWSVQCSYTADLNYKKASIDDEHEHKDFSYNKDHIKEDGQLTEIAYQLTMIRWWSYYLWEVTPAS